MMYKLATLISPWITPQILTEAGLTSITSFLDEDIFVVGYPKSGNTWFQYLITGLYWGLDPIIAPDPLIQQLVPDLHFKKYYSRFTTPMTFKTHHLPRPEYKRVIYLVRDGRDVMVSYYHHRSALQNTPVDFMSMVRDGKGLFPCRWHEHVGQWLENPYHADIMLVKYEDLKCEPLRELMRICDFVGIHREREFLESVVSKASFDNMKLKEQTKASFRMNKKWNPKKSFIRRGVVGSYKDELPPDVLAVFLSDAGAALKRLQYV